METKGNKPSLGWAILSLVLPVAMILYGTLVVGVRPPVLPLIGAVALAGLMGLKTGYRWEELQEGMFEALGRIQIAIAILALVGMIIAAWLASGTIPAIIYWGLKLIAPEHFLLSAMVLCSVASIATGTSFGTMGTIGVALLGVGQALGYPPAMTVGAIVSGAYIGDKMSPVSDSTNITASVCEVPLFDHILSMLWTTVPAFVAAGIVYTVRGFSFAQEQTASLESLNAILSGLEGHFSLDFVAFIPPILMIALAYKRFPVLPVMVACLLSAVAIAVYEGVAFNDLAKMMTSGYVSKTGIKQLDPLLSRGGLLSIMPTVLLLCSGMAFSGQALFDGTPIPGALIDVARLDPAIKPNVAQPEDPNAPPQDDKAQPKAKKQDKQPTPQPISAFGATQQVKADSQGVFTFVCPLPGWWAFSTSMAGDPLQDPEGKQKPLEIKTIFWVYMNDCPKTAPSKK